jgi:hypothetical protein
VGDHGGEVRCPALGSAARAVGQPAAKMDDRHRSVARWLGTELGLQTAWLTFDRRLTPARHWGRRTRVDQSSSGRKMCGAEQELQIGAAASRSPNGIGTLRSG